MLLSRPQEDMRRPGAAQTRRTGPSMAGRREARLRNSCGLLRGHLNLAMKATITMRIYMIKVIISIHFN